MPYKTGKGHGCPASKPWAVFNSDTGDVRGCHPSKKAARQQQKALYRNVPDAKAMAEIGDAQAEREHASTQGWLTGRRS